MLDDSSLGDETASVERRVENLLDSMTLEEKSAQLGSVNAEQILNAEENLDREAAEELLSEGIGHITRIGGGGSLPPKEVAETTNDIQSFLLEETRLGIPAIPHEECLSGYMGPEGTIFPQALGLASTWSTDLVTDITSVIRDQLQAIGTVQALSPVLDIARDLRWGRVEETFGEDPYLVAALACSYVSGLQGRDFDGVSATPKHFAGHGSSEGGKNRASVNIGGRELREIHLFPFEAAVRHAGAESVMNAYHDIDGIPCASSEWLLTDVLRGEWNFDGTVVSDYYSIEYLKSEHGIVPSKQRAGVTAIEAGIDVELPYTDCYGDHLVEAVKRGELAEETLDEAVRRVLRTKIRKGLVDDPFVDTATAAARFGTDEQQTLTRRAARESITLLKNEGNLLPLDDVDSIAVIGPKADSENGLLGDYAYPAHYAGDEGTFDATTPLDAIQSRAGDGEFEVRYEEGCTTTGPAIEGFKDAVNAVSAAEVAVAFVGARSAVEFAHPDRDKGNRPSVPTSGEGCDVVDLGLPGVQQDLLERVNETGTQLVVVLVSGKPHSIEWIAEEVPAVLHAWLPGQEGGHGIAEILLGEYNPSGHLPVSIPRTVGQLPVHYNRKPNTATKEYVYTESSPLYPFGHGLSYTDFAYDDLTLSSDKIKPTGRLQVSVTATNLGRKPGHDVVQLYTTQQYPSQSRPVQRLSGFERIQLQPNESKRVSFHLAASQLAYHDRNMDFTVEKGTYDVLIGHSSRDIATAASFNVTESKKVPANARTYFTDTEVKSIE